MQFSPYLNRLRERDLNKSGEIQQKTGKGINKLQAIFNFLLQQVFFDNLIISFF